jgi:hypothetical protein
MVVLIQDKILINTFSLTAPVLDTLGLAIDPLAATINHSCVPNTAITFDGATMNIRSTSPIPADTELTVTYIDNTDPTDVRRKNLFERYFFHCLCPWCNADLTLGSSKTLTPVQNQAEVAAHDLAATLTGPPTTQEDARLQRNTYLSMYEILSPSHPPFAQPLARLRENLQFALLSQGRCVEAWLLALTTYFLVDPVHFPYEAHPNRVVHAWGLAQITAGMATLFGDEGEQGAEIRALVQVQKLDLGVLVWVLMEQVRTKVGRSHGENSRFAREVEREAEGLKKEMKGAWPEDGPGKEFAKMQLNICERLASEGWEWWKGVATSGQRRITD